MTPRPKPENGALLAALAEKIGDPAHGLPEDVFDFALQIVPMINVDLLVLDQQQRILLAWREDAFTRGWHVPGGVIRRGERDSERIRQTALRELGVEVTATTSPVAIAQLFGVRGHFISMVHLCTPKGRLRLGSDLRPAAGDLAWFSEMPSDTYASHGFYHDLLPRLQTGDVEERPLMYHDQVDERSGLVSPHWLD